MSNIVGIHMICSFVLIYRYLEENTVRFENVDLDSWIFGLKWKGLVFHLQACNWIFPDFSIKSSRLGEG